MINPAMPKYFRTDWNGCSISVRPLGIRRIFWCLPFFVGDAIRVNLTVKRTEGNFTPDNLICNQVTLSYDEIATERPIASIPIDSIPKGKCIAQNIVGEIIVSPCDGYYTVYSSLDPRRRSIMTFHAHPSEKLAWWLLGLGGPAIGFFIAWLVSRCWG